MAKKEKRGAGRFILSFILLLAAGGTAFYFGWIQIRLPEHHYAVIHTKTSGYDDHYVTSGEFVWRVEALIPGNLTLHTFELKPETFSYKLKGNLPSGGLYGQYFEGTPDFSYNIDFRISYQINPDRLIDLVKDEALDADDLDSIHTLIIDSVQNNLENYISSNAMEWSNEELPGNALSSEVSQRLEQQIPEAIFTSVRAVSVELPDISLYKQAKESYLMLQERRQELELSRMEEKADYMVSETVKVQILEQYGKLFNEYPNLIDALSKLGESEITLPTPDFDGSL